VSSVARLMIAASSLVLYFGNSNVLIAAYAQQEVCDLGAGYSVGAKEEAIRRHTRWCVCILSMGWLTIIQDFRSARFETRTLSADGIALLPIVVRWRNANGNKSRSVENA
jgi:hypothetical protein